MSKTPFDANWDERDAMRLVVLLAPKLWDAGWAIGLTGSVLLWGSSAKDLDVVLFPLSTAKESYEAARRVLEDEGLTLVVTREGVHKQWRRLGSEDEKHVEVWTYKGKRVDVFFLR